ncbi:Uncharacterized protein TCM_032199 [Theobroma cacao]|uniref:Uncharacterized protein n=1 Tax=Theobroma cacao TaxID=3641 RepID=A0A061FA61_THECC|nr:Uncharacterized protein TCM_032199 [Theobroma cacao]
MGKDWRSIKGNSLVRSKSTQKEVQVKVKAASIKESQTIYRCAAILISLFNMTTMTSCDTQGAMNEQTVEIHRKKPKAYLGNFLGEGKNTNGRKRTGNPAACRGDR